MVNRSRIIILIISVIAIVTSITALVGYNIIAIDTAILYGCSIAFFTILLEAVIPILLDYSIAPKVLLKIQEIKFEKKTYLDVEGYLITASVINTGKRIALNLDATIQIKSNQGEPPNFLTAHISERDNIVINANATDETFESDKYAWIEPQERITLGQWGQLRQKDCINLRFPYISHVWVTNIDDPVFDYYDTLLSLDRNTPYEVTIEVKGEDAEKNTVYGKASKKITI